MAGMSGPAPSITRSDVAHLARLARIAMTDEELDHLAGQLDVILGAVARVQEVAAADIPPTSHAVPMTNVLRPDAPAPPLRPAVPMPTVLRPAAPPPPLGAALALAAAPAAEDGRFRVPQILGDPE